MILKALLITVIIVLTVLLITAVFLQKQTVKKVYEEKETFSTSIGLIPTVSSQPQIDGLFGIGPPASVDPSGVNGTGFGLDAIIKIQKEINDIKNTQDNISKATSGSNIIGPNEFIKFRDITSNQFRDISTSNAQFQTIVNTRFNVLQNADTALLNNTNAFSNNMLDFTNKLNTTNSNVAVINGKLVSLSDIQTSNFSVINSNINDIRNKQTAFDAKLNTSATNIQNIVKSELSSVSGMLSSQLLNSSGGVQTLSNNLGVLKTNHDVFSSNQNKVNSDTQSTLNTLKQASMNLGGSIALAQKNITDVNNTLANYAQMKDMTNYVTVADSSKFASKIDLMNTSTFLSSNSMANYLTKADASNAYSLKTDLRAYALASNLPQQYLMRTEMPLFAMKNDLTNYTLKTDFTPVSTAVTNAQKSIDILKPLVNTINSQYVNKADLPALTAPGTAATSQLTMALNASKTITDSLTASLGTIKASLSDYVTKIDAQSAYSNFTLKSDMAQYAKKQEVPIMFQPLMSTIQGTYAAKADLASYAKISDLSQYATTTDMSNIYTYNTTKDIEIQQKIDTLTSKITALSTNLNTTTMSIFNIIQATDIRTNRLRVNSSTWNQNMPTGWSEGLMSRNIFATGNIGVGNESGPATILSSAGEITGRKFKSLGASNWNWYHVYRNDADQLYFGADDTNRGINSVGNRDFGLYINGKNRMNFTSNGMLNINTNNTAFSGPVVFNGDAVFTKNTTLNDINATGNINVTGNTLGRNADYSNFGAQNIWTTTIQPKNNSNDGGTIYMNANRMYMPKGSLISAPDGRLHISGGEALQIMNKNGVNVGKGWGGTGDLTVEGDLRVSGKIILNGGLVIQASSDGNSYVISANSGQQLNGGNLQDRLWVRNQPNNSGYWYWNAQNVVGVHTI